MGDTDDIIDATPTSTTATAIATTDAKPVMKERHLKLEAAPKTTTHHRPGGDSSGVARVPPMGGKTRSIGPRSSNQTSPALRSLTATISVSPLGAVTMATMTTPTTSPKKGKKEEGWKEVGRRCLSVCLSVSLCLSVCLSLCLPVCLFVSLCQFVCLSVCLSVCPCVCLSVCLCVCLCLMALYSNSLCPHSPLNLAGSFIKMSPPHARTKKITIPAMVFATVVGKNSSNLIAIRHATNTQIEVDKHSRQSPHRTITVRWAIYRVCHTHMPYSTHAHMHTCTHAHMHIHIHVHVHKRTKIRKSKHTQLDVLLLWY